MENEIKNTMSYLGSIKTSKKAKASRENGKKGGRPLSGFSKTCLTCGKEFYIPKWRLNQNPNRGKFCCRECAGCSLKDVNKNFFVTPSSDMAWVLGLMFSDGCYYRNQFSIKSIDRQLLETVRDVMQSTYAIRQTEVTTNGNFVYILDVTGSKLEVTPEYWGMHKQKTLTLSYPDKLPDEYAPDFIRGLFDGDGCIYITKDKRRKNSVKREWSLLGTRNLLEGVLLRLPVECTLTDYKKIAKARCYSIGDLAELYTYLYYNDCVPCLDRKRIVFQDAIKIGGKVNVDTFRRVNGNLQDVEGYSRNRYYASLSYGRRGGRKKKNTTENESNESNGI